MGGKEKERHSRQGEQSVGRHEEKTKVKKRREKIDQLGVYCSFLGRDSKIKIECYCGNGEK